MRDRRSASPKDSLSQNIVAIHLCYFYSLRFAGQCSVAIIKSAWSKEVLQLSYVKKLQERFREFPKDMVYLCEELV